MPLLNRILSFSKDHPQPTAAALRTSATFPAGSTSVDNSQGASQAVADLSEALGPALDLVDLDGEPRAGISLFLDQLDQEASKYENSQLNHQLYPEWNCSEADAQLIATAFQSSQSVYSLPGQDDPSTSTVATVQSRTVPSLGGTVKASTFTQVSGEYGPALVIAIRGSASVVDHVVNANYRPENADHFIDHSRLDSLNHGSKASIEAHAGFLKSAEALDPIVSHQIRKYVEEHGDKSHILFAGHSAGGAVASLLFLRYLYSQRSSTQSVRFSCITFGAPPVIGTCIPIDNSHICLNIINEFDMVSRTDGAYKDCLVTLVRSMYKGQNATKDAINSDVYTSTKERPSWQQQPRWPTPRSSYTHVGRRIVCLMRPDNVPPNHLRLRTVEISQEDFDQLLFCRISVHRRACYAQRVQLLVEGSCTKRTENVAEGLK